MRKKFVETMMLLLLIGGTVTAESTDVLAATKTIGAYKCTKHDNKDSDAETIFNGVKKKGYTGVYLDASSKSITKDDFYDKTKKIKYWSSHGTLNGKLYGDAKKKVNFTIKDSFSWANGNLEFVFLAACNQLNKDGGPLKTYAKAMRGNKAVRVVCGYHSKAPAGGDNTVAKKFIEYAKTGESVKSSWIKANEYVAGLSGNQKDALAANYAVLTHSGNVQYSRFPGFPGKTYSRPNSSSKEILRFRKKVDDEIILNAIANVKSSVKLENGVKQIPIKFKVNSSCDEMVFNDGNKISLDGGELSNKKTKIGKQDLYNMVDEYIKENILNSDELELNKNDMIVEPIVMDDALSENSSETVVAYTVSFPHVVDDGVVKNDNVVAIVDEDGVKYSAINWSRFEGEEN